MQGSARAGEYVEKEVMAYSITQFDKMECPRTVPHA
jgi:hypothetical protein